ncbi:Abi-C domain-containing protein [Acetobacteraceae bacterium EV16G]|uniref:Abi-C domain-containing protein n=1 Tax=Sorlinia euscelidii TaxID=3081148 RepID=A0ABU7TZ23_9PROT
MAITDLYFKRKKRERGEISDVYSYDQLPNSLKVQIIKIIWDVVGDVNSPYGDASFQFYKDIDSILSRELGRFSISRGADSLQEDLFNFFLEETDLELSLSFVELVFSNMRFVRSRPIYPSPMGSPLTVAGAVEELNGRFDEHGIGYKFESDMIIRVDSQFMHSEVVKPVLKLLSDQKFNGANNEFIKAHEHYRHKRYEECINEASKAFESTMKSICASRGWKVESTDATKKLVETLFKNQLLPEYLETYFTSLQTLLRNGVTSVRNKTAAHGQGPEIRDVPEYLARYTLHLTASNILFLVDAARR